MRVLVVEDSLRLQQSISAALRRSGFAVDLAAEGEEGLWHARSNEYDAMVLDVMLPKLDGLAVLRHLREEGKNLPILLLTARDTVEDRVRGLDEGADDYLVKPFAIEELVARVQALCRRRYNVRQPRLQIDALAVDLSAKQAAVGEVRLELMPREYALLEYLAVRAGVVVSRTEIEEHIYNGQVDPMSNVVDSAVCILRRKLAEAGAPPLIHTRRGQGYVLAEPCPPSAAN